ncbi:hypothetical protein HW555_006238 [Spodoptera exigua]|uniref:DNA mismatch repair proteins mutS family domain-containing protein n=1 Tax=Spodoptera exigua TaxID=7107 RepID=A0A835L4Q1_SPOEX|nr:hypothetical protein HW555_006238 [Spodoptera exigua]
MSKRNSTGATNTLFNYFSKTPPANKKVKSELEVEKSPNVNSPVRNGEKESKAENKKRERQITPSPEVKNNSESEDEAPIAPKRRKRIRLNPVDSDDSDVENKADNKMDTTEVEKPSMEKKLQDSFKYEPNQSPKAKPASKPPSKSTSSIKSSASPPKPPEDKPVVADDFNWIHCKLEWLKPEKIRDAQKRRPDHPDYDPSTLFVPPEFYKNQTPAHRQWWEMKSSHFDCVLFFKVGKFYELYHMDAAVGVNELGFSYMKGDFAHSGFPESAYGRMASTLVSKGYKVARVEQTETPDMMQERCRKIRREICQVTMRGAQVCGLQDNGPADPTAAYMMAIAEEIIYDRDALGLTPAVNCYLAIKALGGVVSCLTDCLLDIQVLGMNQFTSYAPPDVLNKTLPPEVKIENRWEGGSTMVLDAITLRNLRIVQDEGCLYERLNFCSTHMGKRLLYQWVCAPSCNISVIKERQEAVKALFENQELCQDAKSILTTLPDLERLLAKVHALGNLKRSKQHPDSRAIFYEEKSYSKRKVLDFISVLNGFTAALKLVDLFSDIDSKLLKRIMQFHPDGKYPDYRETLKFFKEAFNQEQAEKEGRILPGEGVDQEYDNTLQLIQEIEGELKEYLSKQEKYFKCRLSYVGTDKKRYQIEVPQNAAAKAGPDYNLEGARKGFKRFSTSETKDFLARMIAAEEQKTNVLKDLSRRIFEKFSSHYNQWETAVQCLSTLDILLAFTEFARQQSGDVCLPQITFEEDQKPYLNIVEGRHPCISNVVDFIPNDTQLGTEDSSLLLLTGPNMGGKSTLMRQAGLITVLAHLGSYVPAEECKLSLVDRIFTRLGASDDIFSGQSTFLVEMNETAAIVTHATVHSLVLLDELGRGTSTYDGTAIASGVCVELAKRGCRVIFSTHYHSLVHHLSSYPGIMLGHMACMVETDESAPDSEDNIPEETITFLYKLSPGACPKSYGFNAARLAGIPKEITLKAHQISKNLEKEATCVRAFRDILKMEDNPKDVRAMLAALSI